MTEQFKAGLVPALVFMGTFMNKRMQAIVKYMEAGRGVVDVGTDHGYFPAWMASHGYKGNIIASDINAAPLQKAIDTAREAGVEDKIRFQLSDGLDGCPPDLVDTIVIAGMGGELICRILDRAEWCMNKRYKLILQPMTKSEVLRYWLVYNEFEISSEELVLEGDTIYQLIVARFGGLTKLTDAELFIGKKELCMDPELYGMQRKKYIKRFESAVAGMEESSSGKPAAALGLYREILTQLMELN